MRRIKQYYKEPFYIHYSNCHEDADFALRHIQGRPQTILTLASALDNALAFLLLEPKSVVAIDYNESQIHLCKLKKCGIEQLDHGDFLILLGMAPGDSGAVYDGIRPHLDDETRTYFDSHRFLIDEVGLVNCGKFEYYFQFFKKHILSKTHSRKTVDAFMSAPDLEEQIRIYNTKFNNLRFRLIFNIFFSKTVMKLLGRDKDYFLYAKGSLGSLQKKKFDRYVNHNLNKDNPYLQYILQGKMTVLPTYLQKENYEKIKANIHRLEIRQASFNEEIRSENRYDLLYLSDIFEYMTAETTQTVSADICNALNPGGQVLLYNMMIPRRLSGNLRETRLNQDQNRTFYYMDCYHYVKD